MTETKAKKEKTVSRYEKCAACGLKIRKNRAAHEAGFQHQNRIKKTSGR